MGSSAQPLVSIVIPTYNQRPDFLLACLESAINQTYGNIEIVVSDNHSTNEAVQVMKEFSAKHPIKIIRPPQHLDIIDNFNFAAENATGEYITFLSSDDLLYPECIAKVTQHLIENSGVAFSYCENAMINEKGECQFILRKLEMPAGIYPKKDTAFRMYNSPTYWIIGGIMRTADFRKIGFERAYRAGDWLLGLRLLKYGDVAYCNEVLSAIRFYERQGEAKNQYAEAYLVDYLQRPGRHALITGDVELLNAIGMSREKALAYRDRELLSTVITLVRQYHDRNISGESVNKIFELYKQSQSGLTFKFLTGNYRSKAALLYTYFWHLRRRIYNKLAAKR